MSERRNILDIGIGKLITGVAFRDAVHVDVMPAKAKHRLKPSQRVAVIDGIAMATDGEREVGIVDPFLAQTLKADEEFYVFLFPGSITSLRHDWTHPVVDRAAEITPKSESVGFISAFAHEIGSTYDEVMMHADDYVKNDEYWCEGARWESQSLPDKFWDHYSAIRGEKPQYEWGFFSCAC